MTTETQDEAARAFAEATRLVADAYPLPAVEFLTGVADGWHAVRHAAAEQTGKWFGRDITYAVCGRLVRLSLKYPVYEPGSRPVSFQRCPECAWTVAGIKGQLGAEVQRLMPGNEDREILARLMPDPLIAVTAAAMAVEAITGGHDDAITGDDAEAIQILAAITRHAPVILLPEECADGECQHGEGHACPRPQASAACAACSLQAGPWAGEWEGTYRHECKISAPCAVLTRLAESAAEMLAEAKREAMPGPSGRPITEPKA